MVDRIDPAERSKLMAAVRSKNTRPELAVRGALFAAGYRYRLHRRDLPGSPDLVLPRFRIAVFVHGCFWHGHDCKRGLRPTSNVLFWDKKLDQNLARDNATRAALEIAGWSVITIWGCNIESGIQYLLNELGPKVLCSTRTG
jgi:DNA mismatch endonuclease (patch repair protein)